MTKKKAGVTERHAGIRGGNEATRAALQFVATDRLITEFEAEHGAVTDHELSRARSTLRQARKRRR